MQCSSCRFENMPGVDVCGRCGSMLRLATAVRDVHPPRARPWVKRLRRLVPVQSGWYRLRDVAVGAGSRFAEALGQAGIARPDNGILVRLVVPGWAHLYCGRVLRGRLFLATYLVLLAFGLLFWGTTPGNLLLGLAFSTHASAALDVLLRHPVVFTTRLALSMGVMATLALGLYLPGYWLLTRFAEPRTIAVGAAPFAQGDVVLVNRWAYQRTVPQPGDVVLAATPAVDLPVARGQPAMQVREGAIVDRVLAGPGSRMRWEDSRLFVNGSSSPWQPLNPGRLPPRLRLTVPADHYLVLPTTMNPLGPDSPESLWAELSAVPASRILGTVYLRHQPLRRWWVIR